jgi:PBP1b-binding outer membrane lipoprotein LpoB
MFNILLIILLLILIILSSSSSKENMTNNYNKYLNNVTSIITKNNIYKNDEPIEITNLPLCNKNILVDYGLNINPLNNDGITVNQIINDPLLHTIEVDNKNYNLVQNLMEL